MTLGRVSLFEYQGSRTGDDDFTPGMPESGAFMPSRQHLDAADWIREVRPEGPAEAHASFFGTTQFVPDPLAHLNEWMLENRHTLKSALKSVNDHLRDISRSESIPPWTRSSLHRVLHGSIPRSGNVARLRGLFDLVVLDWTTRNGTSPEPDSKNDLVEELMSRVQAEPAFSVGEWAAADVIIKSELDAIAAAARGGTGRAVAHRIASNCVAVVRSGCQRDLYEVHVPRKVRVALVSCHLRPDEARGALRLLERMEAGLAAHLREAGALRPVQEVVVALRHSNQLATAAAAALPDGDADKADPLDLSKALHWIDGILGTLVGVSDTVRASPGGRLS